MQTLAELIPIWLQPVRGINDQRALCKRMTGALHIGPDAVKGFPTIFKVRTVIKERLSALLIAETKVKPGDPVTYFRRIEHPTHKGSAMFGWEHGGIICEVVKVNPDTLVLRFGNHTLKSANPLHCFELLKRVGVNVDFAQLDAAAKAIANATKVR